MGLSASTPVGALQDWHVLKEDEAPKQTEPTPMKPEAPKPAEKRTKPLRPTYKQEFAYRHTLYQGGVVYDSKNMVAAWNFLRNNPLTRGKFRPIAHMLHPAAIGDQEAKRLEFYADEIRFMLLMTKTSAPGPLDMENPVHAHGIDVLNNFHGFCAIHVNANKAALETYRKHQEGLSNLDYGV